jgi:site-specific DNA recombinase
MLVVCEEEAKVVRLMFTWYVCGDENGERLSIKGIARKLTEMEVPTYADSRPSQVYKKTQGWGEWHEGTVRKMLANETYAGTWYYGKYVHGRKLNPRSQWIPAEVPAVVSREVWEKAQERRAYNREMAKRNTKHEYLVGRRVTCGQCGGKMIGNGGRRPRRYYYCQNSQGELAAKIACDNRYFRVSKVDAAVWEWVHGLLLEPEMLRKRLEEEQAKTEEATRPLRTRLAVIDDLLANNRRQLEKLLDLYLSNDAFAKEMLTDRKARLETTIAALEKERADLTIQLEAITLTDEQILDFEKFAIKTMLDLSATQFGDFEERRRIIDDLDVKVTLAMEDGQRVAYVRCRIGEAAISIDRPSTRNWVL